jgi:hypothetical protein
MSQLFVRLAESLEDSMFTIVQSVMYAYKVMIITALGLENVWERKMFAVFTSFCS